MSAANSISQTTTTQVSSSNSATQPVTLPETDKKIQTVAGSVINSQRSCCRSCCDWAWKIVTSPFRLLAWIISTIWEKVSNGCGDCVDGCLNLCGNDGTEQGHQEAPQPPPLLPGQNLINDQTRLEKDWVALGKGKENVIRQKAEVEKLIAETLKPELLNIEDIKKCLSAIESLAEKQKAQETQYSKWVQDREELRDDFESEKGKYSAEQSRFLAAKKKYVQDCADFEKTKKEKPSSKLTAEEKKKRSQELEKTEQSLKKTKQSLEDQEKHLEKHLENFKHARDSYNNEIENWKNVPPSTSVEATKMQTVFIAEVVTKAGPLQALLKKQQERVLKELAQIQIEVDKGKRITKGEDLGEFQQYFTSYEFLKSLTLNESLVNELRTQHDRICVLVSPLSIPLAEARQIINGNRLYGETSNSCWLDSTVECFRPISRDRTFLSTPTVVLDKDGGDLPQLRQHFNNTLNAFSVVAKQDTINAAKRNLESFIFHHPNAGCQEYSTPYQIGRDEGRGSHQNARPIMNKALAAYNIGFNSTTVRTGKVTQPQLQQAQTSGLQVNVSRNEISSQSKDLYQMLDLGLPTDESDITLEESVKRRIHQECRDKKTPYRFGAVALEEWQQDFSIQSDGTIPQYFAIGFDRFTSLEVAAPFYDPDKKDAVWKHLGGKEAFLRVANSPREIAIGQYVAMKCKPSLTTVYGKEIARETVMSEGREFIQLTSQFLDQLSARDSKDAPAFLASKQDVVSKIIGTASNADARKLAMQNILGKHEEMAKYVREQGDTLRDLEVLKRVMIAASKVHSVVGDGDPTVTPPSTLKKNNAFVKFPGLQITLKDLFKKSDGTSVAAVYDVIAIQVHSGSTGGGHYVAYHRGADDKTWYFRDGMGRYEGDNQKSGITATQEEVLKAAGRAYHVLLKRVDAPVERPASPTTVVSDSGTTAAHAG